MVKRFIKGMFKSSTLSPLLVILLTGILSATEIVSSSQLAIVTASISIVIWIVLLIAYLPALTYATRHRHRIEEQNFDLGIVTVYTSLAFWSFWRYAFIILGNPEWMIGHWFPSLLSMMASVSGFYFLSVPRVTSIGLRFTTIAIIGVVLLTGIGFALMGTK